MKKLTTILAAVALVISTSAFAATGVKENETVKTSFQKKFTGATNVTWNQADGYYFAHFELNEADISVAYNEEGQLVAISRILAKEQLPAELVSSLKENFADYTLCSSVTEITVEGEKSYYVNIENKNSVLRLKCSPDGQQINLDKRTRKKELVGKVY